jgi:RNA polymerase sigma factor (sigma-70 family)
MPDAPGDPQDFTALYQKTVAPLRRYLARLLGNTAEAQDVAHDAFVRVYSAGHQRPADRPEALLYVTARRLAINRLKRRAISPFVTAESHPEITASSAPTVEQQVMARQELSLLERAIAELPPGCRNVLLLHKVELLSHREIADRLGIAVSTVEKQHARALRLLRAALPADFGTTSAADPSTP